MSSAVLEYRTPNRCRALADRGSAPVLDECLRRGIAFVPFCPLGLPRGPANPVLTSPVVIGTAARLGVNAAVGYYGGQIAKFADEHPKASIMLHFGKLDQHIPKESIDAVETANPEVPVFWYNAGHGFNCNDRASYNAEAAKLAKERSLEFLKKHLV